MNNLAQELEALTMEDCDEEEDDAAMRTPRGADKRKDCERAGSSPLKKKSHGA